MPSAVMSWNSERRAGRRIELMKPSWKGLILYEGRHTTISQLSNKKPVFAEKN